VNGYVPPTIGVEVGPAVGVAEGVADAPDVGVATEVAAGDVVGLATAVWHVAEPLSVNVPPYAGK
jgi:hypothetical protein